MLDPVDYQMIGLMVMLVLVLVMLDVFVPLMEFISQTIVVFGRVVQVHSAT